MIENMEEKLQILTKPKRKTISVEEMVGREFSELLLDYEGRNGEELLADISSMESWERVANRVKEGKVSPENLGFLMAASHVRIFPLSETGMDVYEVLNREVKKQLKGKFGKKLIETLVDSLESRNLLPAESTSQLEYLLPESLEDMKNIPEGQKEKISSLIAKEIIENLNKISDFDMVYDKCEDMTLAECFQCLDNALELDNPTEETLLYNPFYPIRTSIFEVDMKYKTVIKTDVVIENEIETLFRTEVGINYVILYTFNLGKIQGSVLDEALLKSVNIKDRQVIKYIVNENVTPEQFEILKNKIKNIYCKYMDNRFKAAQDKYVQQ